MDDKTKVNKSSTCKHCSNVIASGVDCVGCEGFCNNFFHASCVKLSHEDLIQYRRVSNFWWLCNQCSDMMHKHRDDRSMLVQPDIIDRSPKTNDIIRIDDEISKLKEQIADIHQSLLQSTVPSVETNVLNEHRPLAESSPSSLLSYPDIQRGTKLNSSSQGSSVVRQRNANDRFWLFFSRVTNCVDEHQISKLVSDSLETNDADVKKLVPAGKDVLSMPYVSFKVGVNARFKELALLPSTWPTGLRFREFKDDVWQPL